MLAKLSQRLSDPLFYRKRFRQLTRPLFPPRKARSVSLDELLAKDGPWLVAIAHPDDELFASGLLCELSALGRELQLVCLTKGEGGITGKETREELGKARETELRNSAAALGVSSVSFLGHLDPLGKKHRTYAPEVTVEALAGQIGGIFQEQSPAVVLTHGSGGEYWHPAHLLMRQAVLRAAAGKTAVLTLHAWQPEHPLPGLLNRDDPADLRINGAEHREQRLAAFRAHRSQFDYFAGHGGGSLEGFVDRTAQEAYRHYPAESGVLQCGVGVA